MYMYNICMWGKNEKKKLFKKNKHLRKNFKTNEINVVGPYTMYP